MKLTESRVNNQGVMIHVAETNAGSKEMIPLVIIPGLSECAEDYLPIMERFAPRHCVVITLRGRGKSDSPSSGYTLEDHISDIDAAIQQLKLTDFILLGYSRGVAYTIGYALQNTSLLKGLIIGDYPAVHTQLRDGWVDFMATIPPWRGKTILERMSREALEALQKESVNVVFWDELSRITCSTLIIQAGKDTPLSPEALQMYKEQWPDAEIVVFNEFDHNLFEPNAEIFIETVDHFMRKVDRMSENQ